MAKVDLSFFEMGYLDTLSRGSTPIHRLDPRVKLATALVFIVTVVSFGKYEVSALLPFAVYPIFLAGLGQLPLSYITKKMLLAAPFAFFIGIFNPLLDRGTMVQIGPIPISGGWISFASIMIRLALTVSAALILIATTGFNAVCMAMEWMRVPRGLVMQMMFLYRYIFVLTDEAGRMARARALRSCGARGMELKVFTQMVGQLLLRTLDRAQRIHMAMLCRGFDGQVRVARTLDPGWGDAVFLLGWTGLLIFMRFHDLPRAIGNLFEVIVK